MYISTLRGYIEAMGGELDIVAKFPDGAQRVARTPRPRGLVQPTSGCSAAGEHRYLLRRQRTPQSSHLFADPLDKPRDLVPLRVRVRKHQVMRVDLHAL